MKEGTIVSGILFFLFSSPVATGSTNPPSRLSVCFFAPQKDAPKFGEGKRVCVYVCVNAWALVSAGVSCLNG